jgi:glycosyltransferase involved in cell wall biosynthesis
VKRSVKKSVLMVCSQMPPVYGGAGAQAALLGSALAKMGWDVAAVTLDQFNVGSGSEQGIRFYRLMRGVESNNKWTRILTTIVLGMGALARIIIQRPAIVHVHGAYWWSIPPVIAGRLVGAKVVIKLTRDGEDDARTVYSKRMGPIPAGRVYGLSLRLADAVVVLNEHARGVAVSEGLGGRAHLMPNGVDEVRLKRSFARRAESRAAMSLSSDDRVVIFVGYVVRHKGVVDLLEAWRHLGNRSARLWLVGPVEGFYRELDSEIPQLIEDLVGDGYQVAALGHVPSAELPALYWAADVFTLPSYAEGMPNSLAEAMVAGCHIVATRIPGITDLMGSYGAELVAPGDVAMLCDRLADALERPRAAPRALSERLGISTVAKEYEHLYFEMLSGVNP